MTASLGGNDSRPFAGTLATALAHVIGWLLLAIGFVAGLTPSEGEPSPSEIGLFAVLPVLLIATGFLRRNRAWTAFTLVELSAMLVLLHWLFTHFLHYWD